MRRFLLAGVALATTVYAETPEALLAGGHFKRLQTVAEERLQTNAADAQACYYLALVKLAFNLPEQAQQLAERAIALDAKVSDYHRVLSEAAGLVAERSSTFKQMSLARVIKKEADRAVELDPKNVDALLIEAGYYRQAPGILGGDKAKAERMEQQIAAVDPVRGALLRGPGRGARGPSTETLERVASMNPRSYLVQNAVGSRYLDERKLDGAERRARTLLSIDPGRHNGYGLMAAVAARRGQWVAVENWLAEGEKNVPDNLSPYLTVARVLLADKVDLPRAEKYVRRYLSQPAEGNAPSLGFAHWQLGLINEQLQEKKTAVRELQTAVSMDPRLGGAKKDLERLKH